MHISSREMGPVIPGWPFFVAAAWQHLGAAGNCFLQVIPRLLLRLEVEIP
jgi:hypothetical protein